MTAAPCFAGVMVADATFIDDTTGGITVQWADRDYVNLTSALKETLVLYESHFPELSLPPWG
jgi:hypothetical protein